MTSHFKYEKIYFVETLVQSGFLVYCHWTPFLLGEAATVVTEAH